MEWIATLLEFRDKGKLEELNRGQLFEMSNMEIKERESLERIYVRAQISKDPAKLPDGDLLWVTDYRDAVLPEPMRIKILERLGNPYDSYY